MPDNSNDQELPLVTVQVTELDIYGWVAFGLVCFGLYKVFSGGKYGTNLVRR